MSAKPKTFSYELLVKRLACYSKEEGFYDIMHFVADVSEKENWQVFKDTEKRTKTGRDYL